MGEFIEIFPKDIILIFYSYLDYANQIHFSGTCKYLHAIGEKILPQGPEFDKKKMYFILERATSTKIWQGEDWMKIETFAKRYDENFYPFRRTGFGVKEFAPHHPDYLEIYEERIWNVKLYGKPPDRNVWLDKEELEKVYKEKKRKRRSKEL